MHVLFYVKLLKIIFCYRCYFFIIEINREIFSRWIRGQTSFSNEGFRVQYFLLFDLKASVFDKAIFF